MKVHQLIEKLGEFPPEMDVIVDWHSDYDTVSSTESITCVITAGGNIIHYFPNQWKKRQPTLKEFVRIS
jgi:hypothetical protein